MRGGKKRFTCDFLLEISRKLQDTERVYKKLMVPLIRDMFLRFYAYREHFTSVVNVVAELDVLCSLALFSSKAGMCRPNLFTSLPTEDKEVASFINIKALRNPLFLDEPNYVANDIKLGTAPNEGEEDEDPRSLLITGPNMGGKSTLLRTSALAIVLA